MSPSNNLPELLAPAGDFEKLKIAIHYGADAVYLGSSRFSLRHKACNFELDELDKAVKYAHDKGKKVYITVNIFPHNRDLPYIEDHLVAIKSINPDGIIISDLGVFEVCITKIPNIAIHISTQANITNKASALFWQKMGAKRLILSRELSIDEIKEIRDTVSLELEVFVHGSICLSYSGRCYISSFLAYRSANLGLCTNSCRWNYTLMEEKRPNEYMPVFEDDRGTYLMSSKDLCMIEHIDKLANIGIDSFKIEGRIKGVNYVGGVVKVYREAIDSFKDATKYKCLKRWKDELNMFSSRGYTTGMFFGPQSFEDYNFDGTSYSMTRELVGIVQERNNDNAKILMRNRLDIGEKIEFLTPKLEDREFEVQEMSDLDGLKINSARNEDIIFMKVPKEVRPLDIVRKKATQR